MNEHYEYGLDRVVPFTYLVVACPTCAAAVGQQCRTPSGVLLKRSAAVRSLERVDPRDRAKVEKRRAEWSRMLGSSVTWLKVLHSHRARREFHPKAQIQYAEQEQFQRTRRIQHAMRLHDDDFKSLGLLPWSVGRQSLLELELFD